MVLTEKLNSLIFDNAARSKFDVGGYGVSAVIFQINQPAADDVEKLNVELHNRLIKIPMQYPVASVQTSVGYRVGDCFVTVTVGTFEERQFELQGVTPGVLHAFRVEDARVVGQGLSLKIDVNNRPAFSSGAQPATASELIDVGRDFVAKHMNEFLG